MKHFLLVLFAVIAGPKAFAKQTQPKENIPVEVTDKGFVPNLINVKPGIEVTLEITRKTDATCSTEIQVPSKKIRVALPLDQKVAVTLGKLEKGEIRFGCGMNMMEGGRITIR